MSVPKEFLLREVVFWAAVSELSLRLKERREVDMLDWANHVAWIV